MDDTLKKKLLRTAGYVTIGVGLYLVYKGSELDISNFEIQDDIIDAEFEVIDD